MHPTATQPETCPPTCIAPVYPVCSVSLRWGPAVRVTPLWPELFTDLGEQPTLAVDSCCPPALLAGKLWGQRAGTGLEGLPAPGRGH